MSKTVSSLPKVHSPHSLRLGCLILNTKDIHENVHEPFKDRPSTSEININVHGSFYETQMLSKRSKLQSFLTDILSITYEKQKKGATNLTAAQLTTHKLRNYSTWFGDACAKPETRSWLLDAIKNRYDVYLLVGFFILTDAKLVTISTSAGVGSAGAEAPPLPVIDTTITMTAGVRGTRDVRYGRISVLDIPGDQIFGVWYRKVKFKWSFSRDVGVPSLSCKTRWIPFWDVRDGTSEDSEDEEEDVLEACLDGDSDWEEDEDDNGDGGDEQGGDLDTIESG